MRILVAEPLVPEALALLRPRHEVDVRSGLTPAELSDIIGAYDALIVRSATRVTAEVFANATHLKLIARAGIGVDNIDVEEATRRGIMAINVPNGNVVAVAEHTLGLMLALARHIPRADASLRAGKWSRSALEGIELSGRTLGIVGLGRIGSEVARRAEALGMDVIAADPLVAPDRAGDLGVRLVALDELLAAADFISFHVPALASTRNMVSNRELAVVKPGCRIINCARGGVVNEEALLNALENGRVAGAALDVFEREPPTNERLLNDPRIVLTPHIGGSTVEARTKIGFEVAEEVLRVLDGQPPLHPVNLPVMSAREWQMLRPYLTLSERLGTVAASLITGQLQAVTVETTGDLLDQATPIVASAVLQGLLAAGAEESINFVNAKSAAKARGLTLLESRSADDQDETRVTLRLKTTDGTLKLDGEVARGAPHVVHVDDYWLEFPLQGHLVFSEHREGIGILGEVGTILGNAGVSISFVQLGRSERGGRGLMVLGLDDPIMEPVAEELKSLPSVVWVRQAALPVDKAPNGRSGNRGLESLKGKTAESR